MQQDFDKIKNRILGNKPSVKGLILRFVFSIVFFFGVLFTILQIADWFGWQHLKTVNRSNLLILLGEISLALTFIYLIIYLFIEFQEKDNDFAQESVASTQIADLRAAYEAGSWNEVIKIGSVLSRPLWVTGKYKQRLEVGKMVEAASAFSGQFEQQASALIDDLGWTKFELGRSDPKEVNEARANILHGIDLAKKVGNFRLAYKGHRHLSGIALEKNDLGEAESQMALSIQAAMQIQHPDNKSKDEIEAGLKVNQALIEMKKRNWDRALEEMNQAQEMYREIGDKDREVKLYHFRGDLLYEMGQLTVAKDVYREGLSASRQESRRDGILNNTIGIAKIAVREDDPEQAKLYYLEAAKIALEMGRDSKANELTKIAQTIHS